MSKLLGINLPEKVAEDPNENNQINESSDESKSEGSSKKPSEPGVVNVKMKEGTEDNNQRKNINVEININEGVSDIHSPRSMSSEQKSGKEEDSGDESNGDDDREGDQKQPVKAKDFSSIEEYYQELRKHYSTAEQWEDPEFGDDKNLFNKKDDQESIIKDEFEFDVVRPPAWDSNSNQSPLMVFENASENLDYEFTLKRGAINDRCFLNAAIMLFKRREEFFENLILDKEHLKDNFNAGFVGFTFFINGEWKEITIDTKIFSDSSDKMVLSNTTTASAYWLYLFAKAYAKAFNTYEVLTSSSICDYLVDFTGGWARMKSFSFKRDSDPSEVEKKEIKSIYDEILRNLSQKYLIGCMYYDDQKMQEDNGSSESDDQGQGDEQIIANSMYIVLDAQEYMGNKLIYLVNHWPKGKWTGTFSVDDESWEANKALAERLNYRVSQSDRTFWMEIHDWAKFFNRLYYCRIFPDTWAQFCIDGHWTEATSGGAPPKLDVNWYPERVPEKNAKNIAGPSSMSKNFGTSTTKNKKTFLGVSSTKSKIGFPSTMKSKGLGAINEEGGLSSKKGMIQFPSGNKSGLNATKVSHSTTTGAGAKNEQALTVKRQPPEPRVVREEKYKMIDVEPRFFLNTQFKLFLGPKTKLIISLMQEDKKLQNDAYLKTAMMIIHCPGKNSRVWEIREEEVVYGLDKIKDIKKEVDEKEIKQKDLKLMIDEREEKIGREIIIQLDYLTILKGLNENRKKKILRGEIIPLNLIPYLDYNQKYSIDRQKNVVTFKEYAVQAPYWLRIFASNDVFISELPFPYQCQISDTHWNKDESEFTAGGARKNYEEKTVSENYKWPINPQYVITFEKNIRMKIVLRKTKGFSMGEGNSIGFILCKPDLNSGDEISLKQRKKMNEAKAFSKTATSALGKTKEMGLTGLAGVALKTMGGFNLKAEQISRVMESTVRILENKRNTLEGVTPKMFLNSSEFLVESSYNNSYAACLYLTFNRIDSPLIIIPTLDSPDVSFGFEINVFSNRAANIYPLNTNMNQMLLGEWNNQNCGGCHLSADEKRRGRNIGISLDLNWYNNPKYLLSFKDKKPEDKLSFEVVLSRSEIIWKPIIARGVVNAMIGIYLFENEGEWKEHCINIKTIDFLPKNYMSVKFDVEHVPRKGFIIMPVTYGFGVKGPFLLMVKSKEEYQLTKLEDNFK